MGKRVLKQGPLQRLEGRVFAWKKRWFVLDAEELSCYASEKAYQANDAAPACVTVADCVAEAGGKRKEPGSFVVRFGQGQLVLRAGTSEQALEWVDLLGRQRASKETKSATFISLLKTMSGDDDKEGSAAFSDSLSPGGFGASVGTRGRDREGSGLAAGFQGALDAAKAYEFDQVCSTGHSTGLAGPRAVRCVSWGS